MANEENRDKWRKYLYITKDYDDTSPNPVDVDASELEGIQIPLDWSLSDERQEFHDKIVNQEMSDGSPFDNPVPDINFEGCSFILLVNLNLVHEKSAKNPLSNAEESHRTRKLLAELLTT
jgi:hypothetical protein